MYCQNCGAKVDGRKKFCDNCGSAIGELSSEDYMKAIKSDLADQEHPYQPTPPAVTSKNVLLALLLSVFFFPGFGVIYAGKPGRGFLYIVSVIGLTSVSAVLLSTVNEVLGFILFGFVGLLFLWVDIDTILLVKRYNKFIRINFRPPEKNEKW